MSLPTATEYNGSIQNPTACFTDPELRTGQADTDLLGLPRPYSGNFADVYRVACPSGEAWAVKCFTREVLDLRGRYQAISEHLSREPRPFNVAFRYLEQGIQIRGRWVSVLKMRWVEGQTLNLFASEQADNPVLLDRLAKMWLRLASELREANIAHGDLQHGNVLLVPGKKDTSLVLKLIDYDGMWVPALANNPPNEVGHPDYQHPQRLRAGGYDANIDRFSHLVIYTALRALALGGRVLWERFDNGDNLLFCKRDFASPASSELLGGLIDHPDPDLRILAVHLTLAASGPLHAVPFLPDLFARGILQPLSPADIDRARAILGKPAASVMVEVVEPPSREPAVVAVASKPSRARHRVEDTEEVEKKRGFPALLVGGLVAGLLLLAGLGLGVWALTRTGGAGDNRPAPALTGTPGKPRFLPARVAPVPEGTDLAIAVAVDRNGLSDPLEVRLEVPAGLTSPNNALFLPAGEGQIRARLGTRLGHTGALRVGLGLWHNGQRIDFQSVAVQVTPLSRPTLEPPGDVALEVGRTRRVDLIVQTNGNPHPLRLECTNSLPGVSFRPLPVVGVPVDGRIALPVELTASSEAEPGAGFLHVLVQAGPVLSTPIMLKLRIQGPRPLVKGDERGEGYLGWRFEAGKAFYQTVALEINQQMRMKGTLIDSRQKQVTVFRVVPQKEMADGSWLLAHRVEAIQARHEMKGTVMEYDSTRPPATPNAWSKQLQQMMGAELTLTVTPRLEVPRVEVRGLDDRVRAGLEQMVQASFAWAPNRIVRRGERWEQTIRSGMLAFGSSDQRSDYTYLGPDEKDEKLDRIAVKTSMTYRPPEKEPPGVAFKIRRVDLKSTAGTGTIYYNRSRGRLERSELEITLQGQMSFEVSGNLTSMEMNHTQKMTVTISDEPPVLMKKE